MKFYKLFKSYYKTLENGRIEKVSAYKHFFGIEINIIEHFDTFQMIEITESQYNRVKNLIVAKLLG